MIFPITAPIKLITCLFPAAAILLLSSGCASFPGTKELWSSDFAEKRRERNEEAIRSFENNRDQAQYQAALARWEENDLKGCRETLERLLVRNPRHLEAQLLLAEVNLMEKRPQEALRQVDEALCAHPDHARALYTKGLVLDAIGQSAGAIACYEQAARAEPENKEYALSYQAAKNMDDAEEGNSDAAIPAAHREPLIADKKNLVSVDKRGPNLIAPATREPPVQTTSVAAPSQEIAVEKKKSSGFTDSYAHAESAVSAEEFLAESQRALSEDAMGAARIAYQKAAANQPNNPQIPLATAAAAIRTNHPELAVELLTPAARRFSKSAAIHRMLGVAYYRMGDYKSSQLALQQALSLDKSSALSYFLMGCTLAKLGQAESAEAHYQQARTLDARYSIRR